MKRYVHSVCLVSAVWLGCIAATSGAVVEFTQISDPPGIVNSVTTHESATQVTTLTATASSSSYRFTHWEIDEGSGPYRVNDALGRARNPATFTIYNPSMATAFYLPATNDLDADLVPDWYEIHYFGTTTNEALSDHDDDGYSLLSEYRHNYNPLLADEIKDGGLSRSRSAETLVILDPAYFLHQRSSEPLGIHSYMAVLTNGAVDVLPELADSGGYRFAFWSVNGGRLADPFGRSYSTCPVTVTGGISVVAHYYPITQDTDGDGIADWYEWHYYGTLSYSAGSDSDGDGFSLAVEQARGYLPHLQDRPEAGGISRSRAVVCAYYVDPYCQYVVNSDPSGIFQGNGFVPSGTTVSTPPVPTSSGGWRFTHWAISGVRQVDAFGVALDQATAVVTGVTTFTAHYMAEALDSDADGIPDWYETYYFGDLLYSNTSDPDGDGYSLAMEYAWNFRPVAADLAVDGGISRSRVRVSSVNLQAYERVEHVLVDGVLTRFFTVWPTNPTVSGVDFGDNSAAGPGDWDGDGDLDLFVGASGGVVRVFQNIGTRYTLNLSERSFAFSGIASAWSGITNPYPALGDWNGDGKEDLAVGGDGGRVRIVSSPGNFNNPQTPAVNYDLAIAGSMIAIPSFAEMTGDTNLDLLVLLGDGTVAVYANSGNPSLPFSGDPAATNRLGTTVTGGSGLSMRDINRDAVRDALASDTEGRIWEFYRNASSNFVLQSKVWGGAGQGFAKQLTLGAADVDNDTDVDAFCGYAGGGLMYLRDPNLGPPANLQAWDGPDSVLLTWEPDRQTRIRGYNVYRALSMTGSYSMINSTLVVEPEFRDTQAVASVTNYYYVTALSAAYLPGNTIPRIVEGPRSDIVSALIRRVALWMPDYSGRRGSNAVLQINANHATGISGAGMDIHVTYNTNILQPISQLSTNTTVRKTALTQDLSISDNSATAAGELEIAGSSGTVVGEGHLFDIYFVVSSNALPGSVTTNVFSQVVLKNAGGITLSVDYSDIALLTVQNIYFLGDVNGDGILSMEDHARLMELLKKSSPPPTPEELYAGDINGNGELDYRDIPLLLRLIHGKSINPN